MNKKTINQCLERTVQLYRDKEAVSDFGISYSWGEVYALVMEKSEELAQKGIGRGTKTAIWMDNSIKWIVLYFALLEVGAIPVLINVAYKWRELEDTLSACEVEYIFYSPKYKNSDHIRTIKELNISKIPLFKEAFLVETTAELVPSEAVVQSFCDSIADKHSQSTSEDVCSILFTSGTTGRARGAMLTHSNIVNNSEAIVKRLRWNTDDRHCFAVPMYHCFGITVGIMGVVHTGASMHLVRKFKPVLVFETIEKYKCNLFNGVPTMFLAMKNNEDKLNYNLTTLKGGLMAGSAILPNEFIDVCNTFGLSELNTAYGQTESSPAVSVSCVEDSLEIRSITAGGLLPDIEVKICNAGEIIKGSDVGEILTRGYHIMKGYYNMPEDTLKAVDCEGWLHTGDLGYLDSMGYLHITGRIKDIIVRGGENISPAEIEIVISQLPWVKQVRIVGVPAAIIQEEVVACIVPHDSESFNADEVREIVNTQLADYKVPRYVLEFSELPMNSNGKILSKELSEMCRDIINT